MGFTGKEMEQALFAVVAWRYDFTMVATQLRKQAEDGWFTKKALEKLREGRQRVRLEWEQFQPQFSI